LGAAARLRVQLSKGFESNPLSKRCESMLAQTLPAVRETAWQLALMSEASEVGAVLTPGAVVVAGATMVVVIPEVVGVEAESRTTQRFWQFPNGSYTVCADVVRIAIC
jgi:hypothetical protein